MNGSLTVARAASPLSQASASLRRTILSAFDWLVARIEFERRLRSNRAELMALDDRHLADIGLTRAWLIRPSRYIDWHESATDRATGGPNCFGGLT
jgi:uncharacterized protein YjiS (DUF1127 family)